MDVFNVLTWVPTTGILESMRFGARVKLSRNKKKIPRIFFWIEVVTVVSYNIDFTILTFIND